MQRSVQLWIRPPRPMEKAIGFLLQRETEFVERCEDLQNQARRQNLRRDWVEQIFSTSHEGGRRRGVAILFRGDVLFNSEQVLKDKESRYIMVIGTIGENRFTFLNLYAPNEDCPNFFKKMAFKLADEGEGIIVVGGDYNCVLNSSMDRLPAEKGL